MEKYFCLFCFCFFISCSQNDWKKEINKQLIEYSESNPDSKTIKIKHNSGKDIILTKFKPNSKNFSKVLVKYKNFETDDWVKTFFIQNEHILYSKNEGISKINNQSETNRKYILVKKEQWFKNTNTGFEVIEETFLNTKSFSNFQKKPKNQKSRKHTKELNEEDYLLLQSDLKPFKKQI